MKKQALAMVASGLLLASGAVLAQDQAAGTQPTNQTEELGTLQNYGGIALGAAAVGLAAAAASDSGGGSSGTTGTTGTTGTN